ncbi:hypothetical protein FOB82_01490 [Corynebacterium xerosis]|uniref:Uncharacterized protein n=1 Tax=Corynebacterium xerosis TaxID=1725 RepID=A0A6B8TAF5_9CORY|nr:hypothetical protein [Corynebacterium xerosis]QGS33817.1 hypothetical protein FOB82_01490 [Corynebacterium xerosis]
MRAIDAATTTNSSTNPAANAIAHPNAAPAVNAIASAAANEPRIAPQTTTGRHHSPSDARRLRFAATWHRRSIAGATADPSLRPAYTAPIAAPEAPPADALVVTPQSLDVADDGERLIAIAPDGRRLHFFHDCLFRWSTRTATEIVVDADVAPGPSPRRLWVRHPGNGTWWTDAAVCHFID